MLERAPRKRNPLPPVVGIQTAAATKENCIEVSYKLTTIILYSTPGHISIENSNLKRYMYSNVHSSTIYSSTRHGIVQDMESTYRSIDK